MEVLNYQLQTDPPTFPSQPLSLNKMHTLNVYKFLNALTFCRNFAIILVVSYDHFTVSTNVQGVGRATNFAGLYSCYTVFMWPVHQQMTVVFCTLDEKYIDLKSFSAACGLPISRAAVVLQQISGTNYLIDWSAKFGDWLANIYTTYMSARMLALVLIEDSPAVLSSWYNTALQTVTIVITSSVAIVNVTIRLH